MKRVASIALLLGSATLLGCASAPRGPLDETGAVRDPWNEPGQAEPQSSIRLVPESLDGGPLHSPPVLVHGGSPEYPDLAERGEVEGTVRVELVIDAEGKVTSTTALDGHELLTEAALRAAEQFLFKPATRDGQPVPCRLVIPFAFSMRSRHE